MTVPVSPRGCDSARVIEVVETTSLRGAGIDITDPARIVYEYWDFSGNKLAERDIWIDRQDAS